ncbi:MAG: copper amine oxidase [Paenibacillaceae bacterium]|jgi:sugar lactone lactonase YvrE|nr:copper amine oxidase [Paenibacillaceae bacterium]
MKRTTFVGAALLSATLLFGGLPAAAAADPVLVQGGGGQRLSQVVTVSGSGDYQYENGVAASATFRSPQGLLVMQDGTLVIADSKNQVVRKLSAGQVSTLAGPPFVLKKNAIGQPIGTLIDGVGEKALFHTPVGLAADSSGNIYVADSDSNAIRVIDKTGQVTTLAGTGVLGHNDGAAATATFDHPQGIAVAADGTVYVADTLNHVIRKITKDKTVSTLNAASQRAVQLSPGQAAIAGDYQDGDLSKAKFNEPSALALDAKGNLYVSDTGNQRIRYIDFSTNTVTTVAGGAAPADGKPIYEPNQLYAAGGFADGDVAAAQFDAPRGIALDADGGLVIADSLNHSIRYLKDGIVTTLAGDLNQSAGSNDGVDRNARFYNPSDVAIADNGSILVADSFNNKIRRIDFFRLPGELLEPVSEDADIRVVYQSDLISFDAAPMLVDGRTMVPVRAIAEKLGYEVGYQESGDGGQIVTLVKGDIRIELTIGKTGISRTVKGKPPIVKETDAAPFIDSDLTYVPIRFFAEEAGMDVQWNNDAKLVIIRP